MHADFEMAIKVRKFDKKPTENLGFFFFKNTKTNAENLIAAADNMYNEQLQQQQKQSKTANDDDPIERQLNQGRTKIYQLAHDLERRMKEFDERVARRRYILDVNLNLHTHCEEVRSINQLS